MLDSIQVLLKTLWSSQLPISAHPSDKLLVPVSKQPTDVRVFFHGDLRKPVIKGPPDSCGEMKTTTLVMSKPGEPRETPLLLALQVAHAVKKCPNLTVNDIVFQMLALRKVVWDRALQDAIREMLKLPADWNPGSFA
jgi:hypothetical protein